jgi:hypothetical protein
VDNDDDTEPDAELDEEEATQPEAQPTKLGPAARTFVLVTILLFGVVTAFLIATVFFIDVGPLSRALQAFVLVAAFLALCFAGIWFQSFWLPAFLRFQQERVKHRAMLAIGLKTWKNQD